jgi:hypothetical protein
MQAEAFPKKNPAFPKNGKNSGFPANLPLATRNSGFPQEFRAKI